MKSGTMKTLDELRAQRDRLHNMPNCDADRAKIINRIYWLYEANILHYMSILLDTPRTAGDWRWLNAAMRDKHKEVVNTKIDRLIYSYERDEDD